MRLHPDRQRKALNHLYWVIQNINTAASEVNTIFYNQLTAGVFRHVGGYETLCAELDLETSQEYRHVHAFQKVAHRAKTALLGQHISLSTQHTSSGRANPPNHRFSWLATMQDQSLSWLARTMLPEGSFCVSSYLQERRLADKNMPTPMQGSAGRIAPPALLKFFTLNWGSSPFLACQYYSLRYIANLLLRTQEHTRAMYYKHLQAQSLPIPAPTALSYYHFLDESFHSTTSQIVGQEMYKDFGKGSSYEVFVANLALLLTQKNVIRYHSGLSCGLPARCFRSDVEFMQFIYQILQSPIFEMSGMEALAWMRKSYGIEHEGFYIAQRYHRKLMKDLKTYFARIPYLWPVNREMQFADEWGSVAYGVQASQQAFHQFEALLNS
ncbi:MAG: hypothetical protein HC921_13640 [Synechococcaceae cyanobacterium SM2_3_1]|nr:hypothetical protein [Synechococcaceae cyanobacterium SM2_3_1]